jgi:hypothetical protein
MKYKFYYRFYKGLSPCPLICQLNVIYILTPYPFKGPITYNNILAFTPSFFQVVSTYKVLWLKLLMYNFK